jgi:hypothetical protein
VSIANTGQVSCPSFADTMRIFQGLKLLATPARLVFSRPMTRFSEPGNRKSLPWILEVGEYRNGILTIMGLGAALVGGWSLTAYTALEVLSVLAWVVVCAVLFTCVL